jgi:hypothetical protein
MQHVYTYTAQSADETEQKVTFTLHDHSMSVELDKPLKIEEALQAKKDDLETGLASDLQSRLEPVAAALMERALHSFNVADVEAVAQDDRLQVTAWIRTGGLRLAPLVFNFKHVEDSEAAQAFAQELSRRKTSAARPHRPSEPFDYWASWVLAGLLLIVSLMILARLRTRDDETE